MKDGRFDFGPLLAPDLPPAAIKWTGWPKYNFIGGHNDADQVPVADLIAAASSVLAREGKTLSKYGLESGPQGYRPLREFLVEKLKRDAGISCTAEEILLVSGSLQALDLVNGVFLSHGDTVGVPLPSGQVWRDRLASAVKRGEGEKDWAVMALEQARASGLA